VLAWLRADTSQGRRFAETLGFRETGQVIEECRLHIADVPQKRLAQFESGSQPVGVRIAALVDLPFHDESFLSPLQYLWADSGGEPPDPDRLRESLATWREQVLEAPGLSPETHWIALAGDRPVGMTFLKRLTHDAAENDYTAVAPSHRGRGIGLALKLHAIAWARENGVAWFYTSSEIGNGPMLAINARLGYRPTVRRIEVARDRV
jgi:GNAT superfamily N-acetyltransferase